MIIARRTVSLLAVLILLLVAVPQPPVRQSRLVQVAVAAVLRGAAEGYASVKR